MHSITIQMKKSITVFVVFIVLTLPALAQENSSDSWKTAQEEMMAMMGSVPVMFTKLPMDVRASAWELFKSINNPNTAIPSKYGELIGLAVAAQIPCEYCVIAHTTLAKLFGATEDEIREAITKGAETRLWSTILNGNLTHADMESFKSDWDKIIEYMKTHSK